MNRRFRLLALLAPLAFGCGVLDEPGSHENEAASVPDGADMPAPLPAMSVGTGPARTAPDPEGPQAGGAAPDPDAAFDGPGPEPLPADDVTTPVEVVDTEVDLTPEPADPCPPPPEDMLHVPGAGEGSFSGCAPRVCVGLDAAALAETMSIDTIPSDLSDFEGCTDVVGDLFVSMHQGADVRELSCLERVSGDFFIWNSPALQSLHGLEALVEVGGDFEIALHQNLTTHLPGLVDADALGNLRAIGGSFGFAGGETLQRFPELPELRVIGDQVFIEFLYEVDEIAGMNTLVHVGGTFSLWRPEGLERVTGFQALESVGDFYLWGATDMVELSGFPSLRCVRRDVDIGGSAGWEENVLLRRVQRFPALTWVGGQLRLEWNVALESFEMLDGVQHIQEILVTNNGVLRSAPMSAVTEVGQVVFEDNPQLSECELRAIGAHAEDWAVRIERNAACP